MIIVTGAAQGIGRATCEALSARGHEVLAIDIEPCPGRAIQGDIADPATIAAIAQEFKGEPCTGLVNNAALMPRGRLEDVTAEQFNSIMAVNVLAPILLIQALAPALEAGKGRIVNIGSVNAYGGESHLVAYSASKAALMCVTKNLAPTLALKGIRICQINLGWVLTENEKQRKVDEGWPPDWHENLQDPRIPYGRLLTPEEVADFIALLFTDTCSLMNGSVIDFAQLPP